MTKAIGTPRLWAVLAAIAGVASLTVTLAFRLLPQVKAAGACAGDSAILKFEFARTVADLQAVFHAPGDACRAPVIAAMDAVNGLDVAAYIPAYTAFAIFAALFLGAGRLRPLVLAAIAAALVALVADYIETFALLDITPGIETQVALAPRAADAAWTKFAALAVHALLLAVLCLRAPPRRWILGVLLVAPALGVVAAFTDPARLSLLGLGFMIAWLPLLGVALWRAIRPAT